jgi:hypothetical protein
MLQNPIVFSNNPLQDILVVIDDTPPEVVCPGVIVTGLNFNHSIANPAKSEYHHGYSLDPEGEICTYGVCDSPAQFFETKIGQYVVNDPRPMCVSFTAMHRSEQDPRGGWRWHKWGEYIGIQEPTCEYLYDEPVIVLVYVYHMYLLETAA